MPIISAFGLFCYDKFEETQNEKVVNMSNLTKPYFNPKLGWTHFLSARLLSLENEMPYYMYWFLIKSLIVRDPLRGHPRSGSLTIVD